MDVFFFKSCWLETGGVGVFSKVVAIFSFGVMRFCFIRILADPCKTKGGNGGQKNP